MAKIISHIWSSARGSVAGITYLTTPSGSIIGRQRVKPVNPNTTFQQQSRQAMSVTARLWTGLTEAQREGWDAAAGVTTFLFGTIAVSTPGNGRALFMSSGSFINYLYARGILPAPFDGIAPNAVGTPQVIISLQAYAGAVGTTGIGMKLTNTDAARQIEVAVWHGFQVNQSHKFYDGPWRPTTLQKKSIAAASSVVLDIQYDPAPLEGQFLFARVVPFVLPAGVFTGMIKGTPSVVSDSMVTA